MLKKICITFLATVLLVSVVEAKKSKKKEPIQKEEVYHAVWKKTYGGDEGDIAHGIVALENGDSVLVGTCKSFGAKRTDICVSRMNDKGEMSWRLLLGGEKEDDGKAIIRTADGNLMVLGSSKSYAKNYDRDLYVAKISLEGNVIWDQSFGGDRIEFAGGIAETDDGGALVVGNTTSYGRGYKDIYIAKLNKNGKMISSFIVGGNKEDSAQALTRTKDGNMVLVGYREKTGRAGNTDFFVLKMDQNGKKIWSQTYGGDQADRLNGVVATEDGGIVATGSTYSYNSENSDMSIMKLSSDGQMLWHKIYGFKYYEYGNAVATTPDGGVMIAGGTNTLGKGDHSAYMIALDNSGKAVWSHVYGSRGKDSTNAITRLSDGSMVAVGGSDSYSRSTKIYILKIDKK
ncbi:MAG: hypothetical protein WBM70_04910 [Sulfurovum sp.]|uniref:hypothetical protein n=1 Tax=Sulfurovum sp. TaxID=1969726 RepID=UPI003C74AAF3